MANFRFGFRLWKGGPWLSTVLFGRGRSYLFFSPRRRRRF